MRVEFEREVETIPIYRDRDGRRGRNCERIRDCAAVYLGGGVPDHLLDAILGSPAQQALLAKLESGGVVVAIAAAAQCCGAAARSVFGGRFLAAFALAPTLGIETNFDPGHDRRLRQLLGEAGVERGVGLASGSALLLGPAGSFEAVGGVFTLAAADADLVPLTGESSPPDGSNR